MLGSLIHPSFVVVVGINTIGTEPSLTTPPFVLRRVLLDDASDTCAIVLFIIPAPILGYSSFI